MVFLPACRGDCAEGRGAGEGMYWPTSKATEEADQRNPARTRPAFVRGHAAHHLVGRTLQRVSGSRVSVLHPPADASVARVAEKHSPMTVARGGSGVPDYRHGTSSLLIPDRTIQRHLSTGWRQPSLNIGQLQRDLADVLKAGLSSRWAADHVQRKPAMDDQGESVRR